MGVDLRYQACLGAVDSSNWFETEPGMIPHGSAPTAVGSGMASNFAANASVPFAAGPSLSEGRSGASLGRMARALAANGQIVQVVDPLSYGWEKCWD